MRSKKADSLLVGIVSTVLLLALVFVFGHKQWLERLDLVIYDKLLPLQAPAFSERITVITIDDRSLQTFGRWPWPRQMHADLLSDLTDLGARAVAFDVLFIEEQSDGSGADERLAREIKANGHTVLAFAPYFDHEGNVISEHLPRPIFADAAASLGHVDVELDSDGLCRRYFIRAGLGEARWPILSKALFDVAGAGHVADPDKRAGAPEATGEGWVREGMRLIPFARQDSQPTILSYSDVINGRFDASRIRDKYVLVGVTASGLGDALSTPAALPHQRMPGVMLHAHMLNGLLQGRTVQPMSGSARGILSALLLLMVLLPASLLPLRRTLVLLFGGALLLLGIEAVLLTYWQLWYPAALPVVAILMAVPVWMAWHLIVQRRQSQRLEERLRHLASHHLETGLPNRGMLERYMGQLIDGPEEQVGSSISLVVIHVDWPGSASGMLRRVEVGEILRMVCERILDELPADAFLAHLNTDDFALVLPKCKATEVDRLSADLVRVLRHPLIHEEKELSLTPWLGVTHWPTDGEDGATLIRNSYTAMFKARMDGQPPVVHYSARIGQELQARSAIEQALLYALERNEFMLFYQPQVSAVDGRIFGVEALIRWRNPVLGNVGPDVFIPVAEHSGLINDIGDWVLVTACDQLKEWQEAGLGELRLAVNLSPLQFGSAGLAARIGRITRERHIDNRWLELEVTETSVMRDPEQAIRIMQTLGKQGFGLAIDDFGTGHSSLANLQKMPFDRLKIDQSFVHGLEDSERSREIVRAIITMAKELELVVVAEGVETPGQAKILSELGCDELQGFLISRPVPAAYLTRLLQHPRHVAGLAASATSH